MGDVADYLESSPYAQIAFGFDLEIRAVNEHHCEMTGMDRDALIGRKLFDAFPANPDRPDASAEAPLRDSVARVRDTGEADTMPVVTHDIERSDEPGRFEERHWQLIHSPLRAPDGSMLGILQTSRDVTVEIAARHDEEARRRSAESGGKLQFWGVDLASGEMLRSSGVDALFGFAPDEARTLDTMIERIHPEDRPGVLADFADARSLPIGTSFDTEYRILRSDGSTRHVNALVEVVAQSESRRLTGVLIDTTAIHRREESLRRLVEEKQALLADVNHRVKNSLQLVSSLLRIEERTVTEPAVASRLRLTAGRVSAITAIHASLYHYADMARVNVSDHLRTFCGQISADVGGRLQLELEDEPLYLSAEKAVPLALVVNELVSRGLEAEGKRPVVVSLTSYDHRLLLRVENAVKSPHTKSGSIGSRLFEALIIQLDGKLTQDPSDDSTASIEFERA